MRKLCLASALFALASCTSTIDSVGYNGTGGIRLRRLERLRPYPNPFKEIGKTDKEIADKIAATWNKLFYGDPGFEAIYVPVGANQAYIQDTLHQDIRTEGIGLAMMIAVELDKRAEFDRLWTWANEVRKQKAGPRRGYFESRCDTALMTATMPCDDPYGHAQMATALIFAHDRWSSTTTLDYEAGAVELLTVMRHKEDENGAMIVDGVTDTFDPKTALPYDRPVVASPVASRPSIIMPAYYELWAEATGDDPFWTRAAQAGRDYWKRVAQPENGLTPVKASLPDGVPIPLWEDFSSEAYRAQINMALDWAWTTKTEGDKDRWPVEEANRLLGFFSRQGMNTYGRSYRLDGTVVDGTRDLALVAANGVSAMVADFGAKTDYLKAVFDMATPTGPARYYAGILDLTALLILSGQYVIW